MQLKLSFYGVGYKMVHSIVFLYKLRKDLSDNFVNQGGCVGVLGGRRWRFKLANILVGIILELVGGPRQEEQHYLVCTGHSFFLF